ncbi:MAG: hypothetical protein KTR32_00020 [Granulosicoccus sp.]|nr:hypothetical protein [Granulosicoccus sp.]
MSLSTFLTEPIFHDPEQKAHFEDNAIIQAMLQVEAALARAQAQLGIIPDNAATAITDGVSTINISVDELVKSVGKSGVPVPALVDAMRQHIGKPTADWIHFGATSQDIVDTAMVIRASEALKDIARHLGALIDQLHQESDKHAETLCMARTRGQLATPTTLGVRIAAWSRPLIMAENEIESVTERVLEVQLAGASGNRTALGSQANQVADQMAQELGLRAGSPWHTDRSSILIMSSWLHRIVAALAKMGGDLQLAARNEIGEMQAGHGGKSSTMPHKSNPVVAESLGSIAHVVSGLLSSLNTSSIHAEDRDGRNWSVEWYVLPQLFSLTGAALKKAHYLVESLQVDTGAMRTRIDQSPVVMAESAVFALIESVGRETATADMKKAMASAKPLAQSLCELGHTDIDWDHVLNPANCIASCRAVIEDVFAARKSQNVIARTSY